jgi:hypothetical protein
MRTLSNNILTLLDTDSVSIYTLVKIELAVPLLHTSAPYNIDISGLGLFLTDCGLKSAEPPKLSKVVDREAYKLTYGDPVFELRAHFEAGLVGRKVSVYYGFFNTLDVSLGGALPGQPLTTVEDLALVYRGLIDSHGYSVSADDEVEAVIECSSPVANLDAKRVMISSKDYLRQIGMPNDTSFDQVYAGSKAIDLLWGKY